MPDRSQPRADSDDRPPPPHVAQQSSADLVIRAIGAWGREGARRGGR